MRAFAVSSAEKLPLTRPSLTSYHDRLTSQPHNLPGPTYQHSPASQPTRTDSPARSEGDVEDDDGAEHAEHDGAAHQRPGVDVLHHAVRLGGVQQWRLRQDAAEVAAAAAVTDVGHCWEGKMVVLNGREDGVGIVFLTKCISIRA